MELNINSPAYFKEHYGIDNEVYRFCQNAHLYFKDKEYSDALHIIGIVPIVVPQKLCDERIRKESVQWLNGTYCVAISMMIDFEEYYQADSEEKIRLTKELILKAVKKVKTKGKFDYESFEKDFIAMEEMMNS